MALFSNVIRMTTITDQQLHALARIGAIARLKELDDEATALRRMFPGLKKAGEHVAESAEPAPAAAKPRKKKGRMMSEEARRLQSEKMKRYWEQKRAEKAAAAAGPEVRVESPDRATTPAVAKARKKPAGRAAKASKPRKATRAKKG
jgi:hypothetical protein